MQDANCDARARASLFRIRGRNSKLSRWAVQVILTSMMYRPTSQSHDFYMSTMSPLPQLIPPPVALNLEMPGVSHTSQSSHPPLLWLLAPRFPLIWGEERCVPQLTMSCTSTSYAPVGSYSLCVSCRRYRDFFRQAVHSAQECQAWSPHLAGSVGRWVR